MKIYLVGGAVRAKLLGMSTKDMDYVVVMEDTSIGVDAAWDVMLTELRAQGFEIFLETKDCYTVRARFPEGHRYAKTTGDFVLARKEVGYVPGTRRPILELGTIYDDIMRRDFCCNALYEDEDGKIVDLTERGIYDIENKIISTPESVIKSFGDDPLRVFRALRFCITLGFNLSSTVHFSMQNFDHDFSTVSLERVREELYKCFRADTKRTLALLTEFPKLKHYAFDSGVLWLKPTMEAK